MGTRKIDFQPYVVMIKYQPSYIPKFKTQSPSWSDKKLQITQIYYCEDINSYKYPSTDADKD